LVSIKAAFSACLLGTYLFHSKTSSIQRNPPSTRYATRQSCRADHRGLSILKKQQRTFAEEDEEMLKPVVAYASIAMKTATHGWTMAAT
jgi:hypothetical protein